MSLQTQRLTYEQYLNGPEIKARFDIVDGVMIMAPAPTVDHQKILRQLFRSLDQFVSQRQLGDVLFAPLDVVIRREPLQTRQPDLLFISNHRSAIIGQVIEGAPDLVAEVLSPSNTRSDIEDKLMDYASLGVQECWLVSPEARSVEVLELANGDWIRLAIRGLGDQVQSGLFPELTLPVGQLFGS